MLNTNHSSYSKFWRDNNVIGRKFSIFKKLNLLFITRGLGIDRTILCWLQSIALDRVLRSKC